MNRAEMAVAFGRGCGFASGRLLGATGPRMESYNWKAKPISPCLEAHEAHPKTTLYGVVFQKLNGPLLTSIRGPDAPATEWNAGCRNGWAGTPSILTQNIKLTGFLMRGLRWEGACSVPLLLASSPA